MYYPQLKYLYVGSLALLVLFFTLLYFNQSLLRIPYFFVVMGLLFVIAPIAMAVSKFHNRWVKFAKTAVYFFFFSIIYELTALALNQWYYPGHQFIGFITIFGLGFPFEEFFFWILLGAICILSWYEFFDDKTAMENA